MKSIKVISSTLIILLISTLAMAQPGPGKQGMKARGPGAGGMLMQIPDLTDAQKTSIKEMATEMRKEILPLRNQIREKAAQLQTLRSQENADLEAIYSVLEEIGELRIEVAKERATLHQEIRQLLNEEQRVWLDSRRPMQRMRKGMNRG